MCREKGAKTACIRRYVIGGQRRASLWVFPTNCVDRNRDDRYRRRPMKTKLKESVETYAARSKLFCSLMLLLFYLLVSVFVILAVRRFRWKSDDLMEKAREKRRPYVPNEKLNTYYQPFVRLSLNCGRAFPLKGSKSQPVKLLTLSTWLRQFNLQIPLYSCQQSTVVCGELASLLISGN